MSPQLGEHRARSDSNPRCHPDEMTIAYLIFTHYQPEHFARLVRALDFDGSAFFVHVDRRVDLRPFEALVPASRNVVYLSGGERVRSYWCGFNQIRATLNLLQSARRFDTEIRRFCLLSGSDFPVKSHSEIAAQFDSDAEFIRIDRRLDLANPSPHNVCLQRYHLYDYPLLNPRTAPSRRLRIAAERLIARVPRRRYERIPLYHGAQWWALTRRCVDHLFDFLERAPDYIRFHRYTRCPEEIFFHSIIKSSRFAENITHDFEREDSLDAYMRSNLHGCHYIDWNTVGVSLPKVLGTSDLDAIIGSGALFARKFEGDGSRELRDRLEERCG
jgi:Core-2/I-Branching enzyme